MKKMVILICLGLLIVSSGCIGRVDRNQNVDTKPSNPPIASQLTPSAPSYASGGLGLDQAEWNRLHGSGQPDSASSPMFFGYENGKFQVQFSEIRSGNVEYIERVWGDRNAVSLEDARRESKNFIPADANFVRTYTSRSGSTIDLYTSESLKSRFSASAFVNGKSGDFIVLYRNQTGRTTTFIISVGNNP